MGEGGKYKEMGKQLTIRCLSQGFTDIEVIEIGTLPDKTHQPWVTHFANISGNENKHDTLLFLYSNF